MRRLPLGRVSFRGIASRFNGGNLTIARFSVFPGGLQAAMEEALVRILTPRRSVDILRDVQAAKEQGRPYVITFVGVNGVGKSTNLAKVRVWFTDLQSGV